MITDSSVKPFAGLVVLELASVLAGPGVGQFFAELGARVIKVENPATQGDVTRKWKLPAEPAHNDRPAYFTCANWGKESLALDIRNPAGLDIVKQLAAKADIVVASYKPGDAKKLGVSYKQLSALNPRLIYGEITGYGPDVQRAGYDAVLQAETGFMHLNGQKDGPPTKMPVALIDILAGHQLKEGILTALYLREKTGYGKHLHVSLLDAAVASLANQATNFLVAGYNPERIGSEHPNIVPYGTLYTTKNQQQITLAVGDDRQFAALCAQLNLPDTASDARFSTNAARVKNRTALQQVLQKAIAQLELQPLLQNLIASHIPAGAVNDIATVLSEAGAKGQLLNSDNKKEFDKPGLRSVAFRTGTDKQNPELAPPPHFGQHTDSILAGYLQLSQQQIDELKSLGAIA